VPDDRITRPEALIDLAGTAAVFLPELPVAAASGSKFTDAFAQRGSGGFITGFLGPFIDQVPDLGLDFLGYALERLDEIAKGVLHRETAKR